MPDVWGWLWIGWGAAFAVIEALAMLLTRNGSGTLSDHLRLWFHTQSKARRTWWALGFGAFAGWFAVHIAVTGAVLP